MSSVQEKKDSPLSTDLVVAEYTALREEILKLTDIQHQLVTLMLISFGTILTVGLQAQNASIILTYPVLALFLAIIWLNNAHGIDMLGSYIQNNIEIKVGLENIGWENRSRDSRIPHSLMAFWGARGIFSITQLLALIAGISVLTPGTLPIILLISAILSIIFGAYLFVRVAWTHGQGKRLVG